MLKGENGKIEYGKKTFLQKFIKLCFSKKTTTKIVFSNVSLYIIIFLHPLLVLLKNTSQNYTLNIMQNKAF